ncbi:MAG TPA: RtcB family protein [Oligoflexia bacterium]|nr:RtcB family protein [Oligoflexia bacterium]HMR24161.1 RtcB family protein [Oligoflexia bacterium]
MSRENTYEVIETEQGALVKAWTKGVEFDERSRLQVNHIANMPFIYKWVAIMPDVHLGKGATIGSVIPTTSAIIPAAVGVDIGCGMMAQKTSLTANDLPYSLAELRSNIEAAIPHGYSSKRDKGAWHTIPTLVEAKWAHLKTKFDALLEKHPILKQTNNVAHLGTLGTGNHFVEVCLDDNDAVWVMLHSGSRGVGNRIGRYFIELAREDMRQWHINLPDLDLAYFPEGTDHFADYIEAVEWAQTYARFNREVMMQHALEALKNSGGIPEFKLEETAVNCHHNYVNKENHYGENIWVTRKGAVRARKGDLGIIPGSMGARSYIVRGLGNEESFHSCSHGAGRVMSRTAAKKRFTQKDHEIATQGVECRKDQGVIDETPAAYKSIDAVMQAQKDLVEVVYTLKQVVCVKG